MLHIKGALAVLHIKEALAELHIKGALAAVHLKAFHAVGHTVIDCQAYSWHRMRCLLAMAAWHQAGT